MNFSRVITCVDLWVLSLLFLLLLSSVGTTSCSFQRRLHVVTIVVIGVVVIIIVFVIIFNIIVVVIVSSSSSWPSSSFRHHHHPLILLAVRFLLVFPLLRACSHSCVGFLRSLPPVSSLFHCPRSFASKARASGTFVTRTVEILSNFVPFLPILYHASENSQDGPKTVSFPSRTTSVP